MVNALAGLMDGANMAQQFQNTYDNSRLNMLAGKSYSTPQAERQSLLGNMASIDPRAAQGQQQQWQADEDRQTKMLVNTARYMKGALDSKNPNAVAGAWNSVRPALIRAGLATEQELSSTWDPSYEQTVHQVLSMGGAGDAGPYANLPSDIRSLKLLQENPELAKLDTERRQASGMVPKLAQTSQGYGWATPGGEIQLAPMGGVASQAAAAPGRADMEADIGLANEMIAAGIPEAQVDAFLSQRGQRTPTPAASQGGAIAQPYEAPVKDGPPPSGYRRTPDGNLEIIPGGPADRKANPPPADQASGEMGMRKELSSQLKDARSVLSMYQNVKSAANSGSAAGDLSLIFAFMKMLDPGSVVREQEFSNAQNAAGIPDRILNYRNQVMSGQRLNPKQREQFLAEAAQLANSAQQKITSSTREYQGIADQYGYDPARATGMADFRDVSGAASTTQGQQPARPMTDRDFNALPQGALYVDPDDGRTYRKR